jgi:cell division protein FtsX
MVWFFYVILINLLKPKMLCLLCLLAGWLAGWLDAVTHMLQQQREHKYRANVSV